MAEVRVVLRQLAEIPDGATGYLRTGRYIDSFVVKDGKSYYTRVPGHDGTTNEGLLLAQFEQRQRPGFYRQEG